jgi:undecaprenyl diphosphate synthase
MNSDAGIDLCGLSHIAFIMDGNRRWAKLQNKNTNFGHKAGKDAFEKVALELFDKGVKTLTFYAFSTENWKRDEEEVSLLMTLLLDALTKDIRRFSDKGIEIRILGDKSKFPVNIQDKIEEIELESKENATTGQILCIALSYGGRDEIVRAIKEINSNSEEVSEENITKHLDTRDISDPELIIRTGGEQRLSNFLPWQSIYSELYFTETLWPDFDSGELVKALDFYHNIKRNFGK